MTLIKAMLPLGRRIAFALWCAGVATVSFAATANAQAPIPCGGPASAIKTAGAAAAEKAFRTTWRDLQPNWYSAYEVKPPKRNVFDIASEKDAAPETIKGVVWAHGMYCMMDVSPDGKEVLIRYYSRVTSFNEGQTWSKPVTDGLLQAFLVKQTGERWDAAPVPAEQSILLPKATLRTPETSEVPTTDAKLGIPCKAGTYWRAGSCVNALTKR